MKKIILTFAAIILAAMSIKAQDKVETTIGADVVSTYVWRGAKCGDAAVQPTLGIAYKSFALEAWGSIGLVSTDTESNPKEFDLSLSYNLGGLTIGVTDYFIAADEATYLLYKAHSTLHSFEANIGYDFGCLSLNCYANIAGSDYTKANGKRAYSSYLELAAPFKLGGVDWIATLGAAPFESAYQEATTGFAVVNTSLTASKDINNNTSLFSQIVVNPESQKAFFVIGFSLVLH